MDFGQAIEALKEGKKVTREGWNGKGLFVMKQTVQESAKKVLVSRGTTLKYENQMLIIKPNGTADSWVPSSSDVFAEDWTIVE